MSREPKELDWHRSVGAFANHVATREAGILPTVGVAAHTCACCDKRYIVLACIAEDGSEVNVALALSAAIDVGEAIAERVEQLTAPRALQ